MVMVKQECNQVVQSLVMGNFTCITLVDLCKTVTECNSSTSCIDPVPTAFFKRVFDSVSSHVLKIINTSLQTGIFPDAFKTAVVKPLLKKNNLDGNALINYRPMSNLPFISKVLKKDSFSANKLLSQRKQYPGEISIRL